MKFYFIIKSFFPISFFQNSAASALCVDLIVYSKDIVMAFHSIDTLNVIYRSYTPILLVCVPQKYVHLSPYSSLITRNALKK